MADDADIEKLRQLAEHRGLKLVRSRRRKAGVGDFGKFGLTDAAGKALLGIGADGLTATARDIEAYLRAGTLGTWQKSASTVPDKPSPRLAPQPPPAAAPAKAKSLPKPQPAERPKPPPPVPAVASPVPPPVPELVIRPAVAADAEALAPLLSRLSGVTIDSKTARRNLAGVQNAGGGMVLAELADPIGCCAWAVVQTIHRGSIGRITMVFVSPDHRRRGIARQLLAAAEQALAGAGCSLVEVMSDIRIDNAHNFFRALKFEQASYRFTRKLI